MLKSIPGTELSVVIPWGRESKRGKFDFYDLDIDVYSLQDDSPSIRFQKLRVILQEFVLPLLPGIEQAGGTLDIQKLFELIARYADFKDLRDLVIWADKPPEAEAQPPNAPQTTTRRYERVNRPGATERGKSQILQQALLGGRPQESEIASLGQMVG